jgi:hypothetical protein
VHNAQLSLTTPVSVLDGLSIAHRHDLTQTGSITTANPACVNPVQPRIPSIRTKG